MRSATRAALANSALLLAVTATASASAGSRTMNAVSEKLQVESGNGKVLVRLTIENVGERPVYVLKALATGTEALGPRFEVRDGSNGDLLDYTGPAVKRGPPGKDDFVALKPHSTLHATFDITRAYPFLQGRHTYQLSYAGDYVSDIKRVDQVTTLELEPVMFAHIRQ